VDLVAGDGIRERGLLPDDPDHVVVDLDARDH